MGFRSLTCTFIHVIQFWVNVFEDVFQKVPLNGNDSNIMMTKYVNVNKTKKLTLMLNHFYKRVT